MVERPMRGPDTADPIPGLATYDEKAAQAAPWPGRELADRGRRGEIATLVATIKDRMG